MRLQVAVLRRQRIEAVVRQHDGLRVLQLHEHARPKRVIRFHAVELARRQRLARGGGTSCQQRYVRALAGLRDGVPGLQAVDAAAQVGGKLRGELIAGGQEHLRSEALEQRPPALVTWQRRTQRTDALRGHDRNQARLARHGKRSLVSRRLRFAHGRKGVVSSATNRTSRQIASGCAEILGIRCKTARWKSSLSSTPSARASPGFMATGKFRPSTWPDSSSSSSGGSGRAWPFAGGFAYTSRGGQKARYTSGFSSNRDKRTTTPSTMLALTLRSSGVQVE